MNRGIVLAAYFGFLGIAACLDWPGANSPRQQGAGQVDAIAAVSGTHANAGLDITKDLAGTEHYAGSVRWDGAAKSFYVKGLGYGWDGSYPAGGFAWTSGMTETMAINVWVDQE